MVLLARIPPTAQIVLSFMQFIENRMLAPLGGLVRPPAGNPGSATG